MCWEVRARRQNEDHEQGKRPGPEDQAGPLCAMLDYTLPSRFAGPSAKGYTITTETFFGVQERTMLEADGRKFRWNGPD